MQEVYLKARAKINLNLCVLNKREDNYHNIESVFQKINFYDEMYIKKNSNNEFKLKTNIQEINNNQNIIYKAYVKLKEKYPEIKGVSVFLNKKIPMQAGLAGGSTDCASFIYGINKLFALNLQQKEMEDFGASIGADVVPCMYNKAVLAHGIGNEIMEINTNFKYYIVIIKPKFSCDTKYMYQKLDSQENTVIQKQTTSEIVKALEENDINKLGKNLYNVFEEAIGNKKTVEVAKNKILQNGAKGVLMSGSGSCIYGIFDNKNTAKKAYEILKNQYETYICVSYNKGSKKCLVKEK